jgi:hypothetical protein
VPATDAGSAPFISGHSCASVFPKAQLISSCDFELIARANKAFRLYQSNASDGESPAFRTVAGRNLVFSPHSQRLFELNDVAAFIWCRLQDGMPPQIVSSEMVLKGIDLATANLFVEKSLRQWRRCGLIPDGCSELQNRCDARPAAAFSPEPPDDSRSRFPIGTRQSIAIAGLAIEISYSSDQLAGSISPTFRHLECNPAAPQVRLAVVEDEARIHLLRNGRRVQSCGRGDIVPSLKWQLTQELLSLCRYEIALHAACLVRDGAAMLVFGPPGAGKSTLCLNLLAAGMGFAADDLTLVHRGGLVQGVPFALTVKRGAWALAQHLGHKLDDKAFRRLDGKNVKYIVPEQIWTASLPIRWAVILDRHASNPTELNRIDEISAIRTALSEAFEPTRTLSVSAFDSLISGLGSADCYALSYADAAAAVGLLDRTCR